MTPKLTKKYSAALDAALQLKIKPPATAEQLYTLLEARKFMWNSDEGQWQNLEDEPAEEPTEFIMVRCWADAEVVEEVADLVAKAVSKTFRLVERSKVYPCRPPKQLESRVYLKFMPKVKP